MALLMEPCGLDPVKLDVERQSGTVYWRALVQPVRSAWSAVRRRVVSMDNRVRELMSQFDPPPDAEPSLRLRILRFFSLMAAYFSVPIAVTSIGYVITQASKGQQVFDKPLSMIAGAVGVVTAIPVYLALRAHRRSGLIVYLVGCVASLGREVNEGVRMGNWDGVVWQVGVLAFLLSLWTELDQ